MTIKIYTRAPDGSQEYEDIIETGATELEVRKHHYSTKEEANKTINELRMPDTIYYGLGMIDSKLTKKPLGRIIQIVGSNKNKIINNLVVVWGLIEVYTKDTLIYKDNNTQF